MKPVALLLFFYLSLVSSLSLLQGGSQKHLAIGDEALKVPGENPLYFCADPKDNILQIKYADLTPNPPKAGQTLTISASGTISQRIEEGAKIQIQVKYGLVTLINQKADFCDTIENVDLKCPLEKGLMTLTKEVDIPKDVPKGKYTVMADVISNEGEKITCLEAVAYF
ncbi:MAG: hypothetical protein Q9227_008676 [Pyrenula ochraceoflavens]